MIDSIDNINQQYLDFIEEYNNCKDRPRAWASLSAEIELQNYKIKKLEDKIKKLEDALLTNRVFLIISSLSFIFYAISFQLK